MIKYSPNNTPSFLLSYARDTMPDAEKYCLLSARNDMYYKKSFTAPIRD